jgi:hypothetical protein
MRIARELSVKCIIEGWTDVVRRLLPEPPWQALDMRRWRG